MKKFLFINLPLFFLCIFLAKTVYATKAITKPVGVDLTAQEGPNPAPPIGTPCGKTMCLAGEVCIKYPYEDDEHCVPENISPDVDLPPSCWNEIGKGEGKFPPNKDCFNMFKNTQVDLSLYQKTCIYQPIVEYSADRYPNNQPFEEKQPFTMCGKGYAGPGNAPAEPSSIPFECTVSMLVYTDVREATLGSYGPSQEEIINKSSDYLAQNYLYNGLFGRPSDLSDTNREAYRTYWRLLPAGNQANLRSFMLNMAHEGKAENINFDYTDTFGASRKTDFKSLYNALSQQVILFSHFPFIRIGCLTDYPVCPEYAQATGELKPNLQDLLKAAADLNIPGVSTAANAYSAVVTAFGGDLDGPYAAITPLDFSSVRGYIVKKKDDYEDEMYKKQPYYDPKLIDQLNAKRYVPSTHKPGLTNISRESLPYIGAIYQGLLSPKFGMLETLQPQWLIDKYSAPGSELITDYKIGNTPYDMPEVKIAKRNFLETIKQEAVALISNPLGWIANKIINIFTNEDKLKGYTEDNVDNLNEEVRTAYVNFKGCPLPISYHLLSPKTAAGSPQDPTFEEYTDHHQVVSIDGNDLNWSWAPTCESRLKEICPKNGRACYTTLTACQDNINQYPEEGDQCCKRHWNVYGVKAGKALTVLNNPKQTDIKNAVIQNDQFSLYKTLLPDADGKKKITDANVDAPVAKHFVSYRDEGLTATAPNGESKVFNPAEPINRINNRAQDTMHLLQNCWVVPEGLQNSPRCDLALITPAPTSTCDGEAFKKIVGDSPDKPSVKGQSYFDSTIKPKLTDDLIKAYADAEKQTGVPCEVLAGIHFKEGDNNPDQDLQSGAPLGGRSLTESAIQAAEELKGKAGGDITDINQLIRALSYYNGGGNSNCQASGSSNCATYERCGMTVSCNLNPSSCTCTGSPEPGSCRANCTSGFSYQFSYPYCPPASTGYDDPYVTNLWKSPVHDQMYILYMYDCTQTKPYIDARPGTLTVAISLFLSEPETTTIRSGSGSGASGRGN